MEGKEKGRIRGGQKFKRIEVTTLGKKETTMSTVGGTYCGNPDARFTKEKGGTGLEGKMT